MTLTELRYIVAVARERHFGRAAQSCFVSQPTLSLGVKKLEEELEIVLFERGKKNEVRPTSVGERIVAQAQKVLEESEALKAMARHNQDPLSGALRLGAIYTIAPYLLPQLIPSIHQDAPRMPLLIEENYTVVLAEQLKQGQVDVIVIALPFADPVFVTQAIYDEPFVIVVPSDHPWVEREAVPANELANENLLLLGSGHCFRDQVLQACPDCLTRISTSLHSSLQGSSLETMRHMVATGAGITVLPYSSILGAKSELLKVVPFEEPAPSRRVALAWRKTFPRPEAIEVLRQTILQCELPGVTMLPDEPIRFS